MICSPSGIFPRRVIFYAHIPPNRCSYPQKVSRIPFGRELIVLNYTQKEQIISMRKQNMTYAVISEKIGVSVGTIKSFCHRNGITSEEVLSK